ncbi:MAG: ATP-dependent helicase, partial [Micropruina sp.]|nr:ATP-dependent helicase [Micropruina sp.]
RQRDHVLGPPANKELWEETDALLEAANRTENATDELEGSFEALTSEATFDHVLFDAQQFGMHAVPTSDDEAEYLGLPGLLEADQISHLLRERQRRQVTRHERTERREKVAPEVSLHRALEARRKELNSLVAQYARVTGVPHSHVHAELRRQCGGPPLARATTEQVEQRIALIRTWRR